MQTRTRLRTCIDSVGTYKKGEEEMNLGKLKKIDLREIWNGEASDFTPWLAEEENIKLLGEAINIDLEVQEKEKAVGPFSADILCKDTISNDFVLIENQLERTDPYTSWTVNDIRSRS
jgi:hypothetical protein